MNEYNIYKPPSRRGVEKARRRAAEQREKIRMPQEIEEEEKRNKLELERQRLELERELEYKAQLIKLYKENGTYIPVAPLNTKFTRVDEQFGFLTSAINSGNLGMIELQISWSEAALESGDLEVNSSNQAIALRDKIIEARNILFPEKKN